MHSPQGETVCHAILLQVSADLPARSRLANMKQFNGLYACLYCENPGSTLPGKPLHRFWPHVSSPLRSHDSIMDNAEDATSERKPVSVLSLRNIGI